MPRNSVVSSGHKFLLQLIEEQGTFSTYKADIINIDNCYNKCFSLFVMIVVYASIGFAFLKS